MKTMKKMQKLQLNRETLATLDVGRLAAVRGGVGDVEGDGGGAGAQPAMVVHSEGGFMCTIGSSIFRC